MQGYVIFNHVKMGRLYFISEIDKIPEEYLPNLLVIIRTFRESVTLKPAEASLKQGLVEAENGMTKPVSEKKSSLLLEF